MTNLHLQLGHLELLGLGDSLLLVPHTQHVSLSEGLVQGTGKVLLGADLLLVVVLHAGHLVLGVPELAEKGLPLLGLVVSNSPGLVQLVGEGELQHGEHVGRVLHHLQLAEKVSVLGSDLPLGSLHVVEGEGGLLDLLALVVEGAQEVPVRLLRGWSHRMQGGGVGLPLRTIPLRRVPQALRRLEGDLRLISQDSHPPNSLPQVDCHLPPPNSVCEHWSLYHPCWPG